MSAPNGYDLTVTASLGIAMFPQDGDDIDTLLHNADIALHDAKAAGRNCVVFREFGEYVTYDPAEEDIGTTNVIEILSGVRGRRERG